MTVIAFRHDRKAVARYACEDFAREIVTRRMVARQASPGR